MAVSPELIFTGARVFLGDDQTFAEAVAVTDGRISAVGGAEVRDLAGPGTRIFDCAGGLLLPGFQDAHVHPVQGGMELLACDLSSATTEQETLDTVAEYARTHPDVPWILGGGWSMAAFPGGTPTAAALDAVVSDRPCFLPNRDHHSGWVNSVALELAGITRDTPDPTDGRIERDAEGNPTGTLHEGAMDLLGHHVPTPTTEDTLAGLLAAQQHLHSLGITAWQDAIVGTYANMNDPSQAYQQAEADGSLTARVVGALWWERERGTEQIEGLLERRDRLRGPQFNATSVKIMQDGVVETCTAAMLSPYCGRDTDGLSFIDPTALRDIVTRLDAEGFQVHIHAIGDRGIREALDALEAARIANGPNDNRHHIAHIEVIDPADLGRFQELDVVANMQALWAALEPQMVELVMPVLGEERSNLQYPFGELHRRATKLAAGSDWPVTSADPIAAIHTAVNRAHPGLEEPAFLPDQKLDLATALKAYTAGSAYVNHLDDTGTIEVGKLADLCVLDRDPFQLDPRDIHTCRVTATFVGGRQVYGSDS